MSNKMKDLRNVDWTNPHAAMLLTRKGVIERGYYKAFADKVRIPEAVIHDIDSFSDAISEDDVTREEFRKAFHEVGGGVKESAELDANLGRLHYHVTITGLGDYVLVHFNDHTKAVTENRRLLKKAAVESEVIHDIKNLLFGLHSLDKAKKYVGNDDAAKRSMESVINMKNTVVRTCQTWLNMARAQDGAELKREYLYFMKDVVEPVIPLIQDRLTKRRATISRTDMYRSGDTLIYADLGRMSVVAFNLMTNALDYGGEGLTIACGHEPLVEGDGKVGSRLVFWNSKSYIEPDDRDKIFDKFYTKGARDGRGTGLGLEIVSRFVDEHHGRISVDSGYDNSIRDDYTSFRIDLYNEDVLRERGLLGKREKLYNPRE